MYGKSLNKFRLQKHLTKLKHLDKYSFWNKVGSQAIQDVTDRIEKGYAAFFRNCKSQVKTRKVSPPSFKKVQNYSSFSLKQAGYKFLPGNQVQINKRIYKYHKSQEIKGEVKCISVKKDSLGDWYITVVCELDNSLELTSMTGKTAGFDFGCMDFLVNNDGTKIESPLFFKQNRNKIAQANKKLSRKTKGSNNYAQAKLGLARLHKKVSNSRKDFHFKLAKQLCETYDVMFFEDLDIQAMSKKHGKKISDLGFSQFMNILKHKSLEYGKTIYNIDKWFASTKTCSTCGYKNNKLTERDRVWTCPQCFTEHNRDTNAAQNIISKGMKETNAIKFMDGTSSSWREDVRLDESRAVLARA
jgi:putative transposase